MTIPSKKVIIPIILSGVAIIGIVALALWLTNPRRTLNSFLAAMREGKEASAMSFVSDDVLQKRRDNIKWFVEDWTSAKKITTTAGKEESWRSRVKVPDDENTEKKNEEVKEKKPTPKIWAHYYHADVTVSFDGYDDEVIITLERKTANEWSVLAQLFKGWKVSRIQYQPLSEEDVLDLEDLDIETETTEDETTTEETDTNTEEESEDNTNTNSETNAEDTI